MTTALQRPEIASVKQRALRARAAWIGILFLTGLITAVCLGYWTVPSGNAGSASVDALIVLGTPTDLDGSVTLSQRWRADEAIREFRAGHGAHILFSGGAAANQYVEAQTMAAYAERHGVPRSVLLEEGSSHTTLENIQNSARLLDQRGWRRVEVISSPEHLPRASVLLAHTSLQWRIHPAPTPGRTRLQTVVAYAEEAFGTTVLRVFGTGSEPMLHNLARAQHAIFRDLRRLIYGVEQHEF